MRSNITILIPVLCLLVFGLAVVHSVISQTGAHRHGDSLYPLERQALFYLVGCGLIIVARQLPCTLYRRFVDPLLLITFSLALLLPLFTDLDYRLGRGSPWTHWPGSSFRLGDVAKFLLLVHVVHSVSAEAPSGRFPSMHLLRRLAVPWAGTLLVFLQGDFETALVTGCAVLILLVVVGVNRLLLASLSILYAVAAAALLQLLHPYVFARILVFLNPWERSYAVGFGTIDLFEIFRSAGLFGAGPGPGGSRLALLPQAHTDFALAVVVEELGLLAVLVLLLLFAVLIARGVQVARSALDPYSGYLALGVSCLLGSQVAAHTGVAMGLLPVTGIALPLVSSGGSSLMLSFLCVGILLGVRAASASETGRRGILGKAAAGDDD